MNQVNERFVVGELVAEFVKRLNELLDTSHGFWLTVRMKDGSVVEPFDLIEADYLGLVGEVGGERRSLLWMDMAEFEVVED